MNDIEDIRQEMHLENDVRAVLRGVPTTTALRVLARLSVELREGEPKTPTDGAEPGSATAGASEPGGDLATLDGGPTARIVSVLRDAAPKKLTSGEILTALMERYPKVPSKDHGVAKVLYRHHGRKTSTIVRTGKDAKGHHLYGLREGTEPTRATTGRKQKAK